MQLNVCVWGGSTVVPHQKHKVCDRMSNTETVSADPLHAVSDPSGVSRPHVENHSGLLGRPEFHVRSCSPGAQQPVSRTGLRGTAESVTVMAQAKIQARLTEASCDKFSRTLSMADRSGRLLESLDELEMR